MALLELSHVFKRYQMGDTEVQALRDVSLSIDEGDFVAIMGSSGSGKSTLMHVMGLLDAPSEGSYKINGREVSKLSDDELAALRREELGFIFQQFNLLPRMSATENVGLPMLYSVGEIDEPKAQILLEKVGLGGRMLHRPNELSGGQQQRVAIARSLVNQPKIIFADEPTGNLDSVSEREIMTILKDLNAQGITVVVVTHEDEIGHQAKRVLRMKDGQILSDERLQPLPHAKSIAHTSPSPSERSVWHLRSIAQHFKQGAKTLAANKVRTALSMLGILIGVAAVVAMLALGRGAQNQIQAQLASLGSNLLVLRPGALRGAGGVMGEVGSTTRLTQADAQAIQDQIPYIKAVSSSVNGKGQVTYLDKNWSTSVLGAASGYARMHNLEPQVGRFFSTEENQSRSRVAVIGATIVRELFGNQNPIGENIKINKVIFRVIGILPERGATGFRDQDDQIIIPVSTAMYRLLGKSYVDYIDIEVTDAAHTEQVEDQVQSLMKTRHRIPPSQEQDSFRVQNMQDIQDTLTSTTRVMTLLLSVIAAISLLVGGIGIMNIMLVSVTERTREVGLRKAVGAKRSDILAQFLVEAIVVSGMGGLMGIVLAWLIVFVLSTVAGWAATITPASVLLAFFFSAGIGVVFGIYPARQASQLNPIDALRYE
jgi:macrolide transport system ATP-binding/permease protein